MATSWSCQSFGSAIREISEQERKNVGRYDILRSFVRASGESCASWNGSISAKFMMWLEYGASVRMAEQEIVDRGQVLPNLALAHFAP
jgi:hypothetical protein